MFYRYPNNPDTVPGCPTWNQFDSRSRSYLELSTDMTESSMKTGYAEPSGAFWLDFLPKIVPSIVKGRSKSQETERSHGDACGTKMADKDGVQINIAVVVLSIVAGLLGISFIVSVYCGLNMKKRPNTTYDAVEM